MSDKAKKIIFAILFSLASLGIGFGLYYFFLRPLVVEETPPPAVTPGEESPTGELPTSGAGGARPTSTAPGTGGLPTGRPVTQPTTTSGPAPVTLLRDAVTQSVVPTSDGQGARFYSPEDGRFYRVDAAGNITALADKQFFNVDNVSWADKTNQAVLEFPDGSNVLYNFDSKRQATLPKHWEDFDFSPDAQRVVGKSMALDPSSRFLFVSNPDGNEARAVEPLGQNANRVIVEWSPNQQIIAFSQTGKPQPDGAQEIYLIGENQENFKSLIVPGRGFMPNWSPAGRQILYSVYHERDNMKPSLWVSDGASNSIGENRRSLNLQTWANKCTWATESEIICGVPEALEDGAGLAPTRFRDVADNVYRIDLRTGVSTRINTPEQNHPLLNPVLADGGKKLIFTDAVTGRLYQYLLP